MDRLDIGAENVNMNDPRHIMLQPFQYGWIVFANMPCLNLPELIQDTAAPALMDFSSHPSQHTSPYDSPI